jgi:hypothetical protein
VLSEDLPERRGHGDGSNAGRDARELLREGLLDVIFDDDAVRLVP